MTESISAAPPAPLLKRCIRHEPTRLSIALIGPMALSFAMFWIGWRFGEFGGYTGDSEFWPLTAVAILFAAQMPIWSSKFHVFRGVGALTVVVEIVLAVLAGLCALLMFSRDWL